MKKKSPKKLISPENPRSYGMSIYLDKTSVHANLSMPLVMRSVFLSHLPRSLVSLSTGDLYSELAGKDVMRFCWRIADLNSFPYGVTPLHWLYNCFIEAQYLGMMDVYAPSAY